jgi:hypothetical protein
MGSCVPRAFHLKTASYIRVSSLVLVDRFPLVLKV